MTHNEANELPVPPLFDGEAWKTDSVLQARPTAPSNLRFWQVQQVLRPGFQNSLMFAGMSLMTKSMTLGNEQGNLPLSCIVHLDEASAPEFDLRMWADLVVLTNRKSDKSYYLTTFEVFLSYFETLIQNGL